jgi:hypothetical protein
MTTKERTLQDIGRCAAESIAEMIAALGCDYDRLEELRDARDNWPAAPDPASRAVWSQWALAVPDEAEELASLEEQTGGCGSREDAEQRIHEDPLSLELSGTWQPGDKPVADKAILLLGTGGPAVRLVVDLNEYGEATCAYLQVQDWGTPWTDVFYNGGDTLLEYARCFYYGEG